MLNFIRLLAHCYRDCPELGWGELAVLDQPHPQVMAHTVTWDDACLVAVHNLSDQAVTVALSLPDLEPSTALVDLLHDGTNEVGDGGSVVVALPAYGYRWLRVVEPGSRRLT